MTVSSQTSTATFVGNGVATAFPLPFRFFDNGDIRAYFIDSVTGAATQIVLGTDYTLIGAGEPEVDGNALSLLTTTVPLASMRGLYVERVMQQVQGTDIVNQGEFFASTHEYVFDRLTMLIQQANGGSKGAIRVAIGDPEPTRLAPAAQRANRILSFDENGNPVAIDAASDSSLVLRQELAAPDGVDLVGGAQRVPEDLTLIRTGLRNIAANVCSIDPSKSVVITGDSLSFNGFGYPGGWPTAGGGYATDNPFGLSSWAHLLRDLFFTTSSAFTPIQDVDVTTDATVVNLTNSEWDFAINQKVVNFFFSTTAQKMLIQNRYSGSRALIVSYAPSAEAVNFTVDGVAYSNLSPAGAYQGRGYFVIPHANEFCTITAVSKVVGGGAGGLWFYGVGDANRIAPRLTGKGAYTSGQILAEYSTLVAPYTPDCIMYIIGANDIALGVPVATFAANINAFIDMAKAAKPNCEILLISTPPTASYSRDTARLYIAEMRKIAEAKGCSLIDLHTQLEQVDPTYYRFDNIHFNSKGDTLVFNIIKGLAFPDVPVNLGKLTPVREAMLGAGGAFYRKERAKPEFSALISCGATPVVSSYLGTQPASAFNLGLAYSGAGATSILIATPPVGYMIDTIENVLIGSAAAVQLHISSIIAANAVQILAANGTTQVAIISSGIFAIVNYRKI